MPKFTKTDLAKAEAELAQMRGEVTYHRTRIIALDARGESTDLVRVSLMNAEFAVELLTIHRNAIKEELAEKVNFSGRARLNS